MQLKTLGAGLPDGGLFQEEQLQKFEGAEPLLNLAPARGAIEVKGPAESLSRTAQSDQLKGYCKKYKRVLLTNYREFVVVFQPPSGDPTPSERYTIADNETAFWTAVASPRRTSSTHGKSITEFLYRTLVAASALSDPRDLARFFASYARDAKQRIEGIHLEAMSNIRKALQDALGIEFKGDQGDQFFRSSLIQTLFYGIFSAWVLWAKNRPYHSTAEFNWHEAAWYLHVPMIKALYDQIGTSALLGPLNLVPVLDWAAATLNRIDRATFFASFDEGHAVQYFYEPFLREFDPDLRKRMGVWFTPPEIVKYMVARVDSVLRTELGIADGLADPNVYVLDPCVGTGSYLVEVLKTIAATLTRCRGDALVADDIRKAVTTRLFGFELLPAPLIVAHLQLGVTLASLNASLAPSTNDRVRVYLTNSLTGWEPAEGAKQHLGFPGLEEERDAADHVKRLEPILVVLGNPPYDGYADVPAQQERGIIDAYKVGLRHWGITKNYLKDMYVRFFRIAERKIAESGPRRGIVCFISNHSWISHQTYVILRKHLLNSFDKIWIEYLHGNREISERTPDGKTSQTIFSLPGFSPGITRGVATTLWVRTGDKSGEAVVMYRGDVDAASAIERRAQLLETLHAPNFDEQYTLAQPLPINAYDFRPLVVSAAYRSWPSLVDLAEVHPSLGLNENRHGGFQDVDKTKLIASMLLYFNADVNWESFMQAGSPLKIPAAGYDPQKARANAITKETYLAPNIIRFLRRPFDFGWAYVSKLPGLWNRSRPELINQGSHDCDFLVLRRDAPQPRDGAALY